MSENKKKPEPEPSFVERYLSTFLRNNPQCDISIEENVLILDTPWGFDGNRLTIDISDTDLIKDLNNISFRTQFDALLHVDENLAEFLFGFLKPDEKPQVDYINRSFQFFFAGSKYECYFGEPTARAYELAKRFRRLPTELGTVVVPQLAAFKDVQRLDKLPDRAKKFFETKVPRNFFIRTQVPILQVDLETVSRHLNFLMHYYDRSSPLIVIRDETAGEKRETIPPLRFLKETFPDSLALQSIDDVILQLIEVARMSSPRFAFLYYYQVFEYAGFYFVGEKAKKSIRKFLSDPAIINCAEERISDLFSMLSELNDVDEVKMRKVLEENCDPITIWKEIDINKPFFIRPVFFDGGFDLPPLISEDTTESSWCSMWMPKFFDYLTKIRNCLVHARERRQSQVILPTARNNYRISCYLPLIARASEEIALCSR